MASSVISFVLGFTAASSPLLLRAVMTYGAEMTVRLVGRMMYKGVGAVVSRLRCLKSKRAERIVDGLDEDTEEMQILVSFENVQEGADDDIMDENRGFFERFRFSSLPKQQNDSDFESETSPRLRWQAEQQKPRYWQTAMLSMAPQPLEPIWGHQWSSEFSANQQLEPRFGAPWNSHWSAYRDPYTCYEIFWDPRWNALCEPTPELNHAFHVQTKTTLPQPEKEFADTHAAESESPRCLQEEDSKQKQVQQNKDQAELTDEEEEDVDDLRAFLSKSGTLLMQRKATPPMSFSMTESQSSESRSDSDSDEEMVWQIVDDKEISLD